MLLRSHCEQDSGQVSLQDLHVGVTKSQLQRDEELGCVAVQQPGSIFRSSGALAFLGHRNSFENTSGTAGGTQKACDHPLEWQPPWRWAAERGTMGRIWPTVKKDEVAQAQQKTKKNHTGKAIKRGKSQFELYQAQVRATCTQNLQAHLFFTETKLRDKQPQAKTFANLLIWKIIGAREVFHSASFFFFYFFFLNVIYLLIFPTSLPGAAPAPRNVHQSQKVVGLEPAARHS